MPHLRSALFVLEAGTSPPQQQQQRNDRDAQPAAAAPFSFEAAEAERTAEGGGLAGASSSSSGGGIGPSELTHVTSAPSGAAGAPTVAAASGSGGRRESLALAELRERRTQVVRRFCFSARDDALQSSERTRDT